MIEIDMTTESIVVSSSISVKSKFCYSGIDNFPEHPSLVSFLWLEKTETLLDIDNFNAV